MGRLRYAHTGSQTHMHAFYQLNDNGGQCPYAHHYNYDVWGNITARAGRGGETDRSWEQGRQPQRFTSYLRDANGSDEAQMRRYNRWWSRFDQPDPYDGSYNLTDPQSLNRYSYVQNDPVNYVDPSGLNLSAIPIYGMVCDGSRERETYGCSIVVVGVI